MDNVAPIRALNRRSTQLLQFSFIAASIGIFDAIIGAVMLTIPMLDRSHGLYGLYIFAGQIAVVAGIGLIILGIALAIRALTRRKDNDLALMVGDFLAPQLDGRYSFIRNINRTGLGYIDAVLLGPPGALVFRIVDKLGSFANEGENWLEQAADSSWGLSRYNFSREALQDVRAVSSHFAKRNLADIPVYGVVVFAQDEMRVQFALKNPIVPVVYLHTLPASLTDSYFAQVERIPQQTVTVLRRLLLE